MLQILKNTTKKISMLSIFLCLLSCNFLSKETNAQDMEKEQKHRQQETIDDYTDTYTITPNYDMPRFKELMAQFNKQEHRFEIDTCAFKYNGQSFFIGDSVEKITEIFGEPDGDIIKSFDDSVYIYIYNTLNFRVRFLKKSNTLISYSLYFKNDREKISNYNIVKFRNMPYQLDMKLNDFMTFSNLTHDILRRTTASFFMIQKECAPNEETRIYTSIGSRPFYKTEGGGHLTFRGDFNPNETRPIDMLSISTTTLEEFKK